MTPQPLLRLVDPQTGEVVPGTGQCQDCHALKGEVERLERDLAAAERDLRGKRAQISALKNEAARARQQDPLRPQVRAVFEAWQQICGKGKSKLTDDRFDTVRDRLKESYTVDDLILAVQGFRAKPWVRDGEPYLELGWYLAKGSRVEEFAVKGHRALKARAAA